MRFVNLVCLSLLAVLATASTAEASPLQQGGDSTVTYTFNELGSNCGSMWSETTTSGLYQDLAFPQPAYMAVCPTPNGSMALQPTRFAAGLLEVRVGLPNPATAVSVETYLFEYGEAPTLVAYDSTGVEVGRTSNGSMNVWATLSVQAGQTPISEIGLLMPQLVVYVDNVSVTYGVAAEPEPEPEPEPQPEPQEGPSDPASIADCQNAGWMAFGFRNQGQCVSFVRNGRDSR